MGRRIEGDISILRVFIIAPGIYALHLPVAFVAHRFYMDVPGPSGTLEMLLQCHYVVRIRASDGTDPRTALHAA